MMTNNRARKRDIRERMASTGEVFSVAAHHVDGIRLAPPLSAWQAFYQGYNQELYTEEPPKNIVLNYWDAAVYTVVTTDWDGDFSPLQDLGSAYRELEETHGNYFCYHHYIAEFFQERFRDTIELSPGALKESYLRNRGLFYYSKSVRDSFDKVFETSENVNYEALSLVSTLLEEDVRTAKDTNSWTSDGMLAFVILWGTFSSYAKTNFVTQLAHTIRNLPSLEEANTKEILYNRYYKQPPVPRVDIHVGDTVKFVGDSLKWETRKVTDNFVILTTILPKPRKNAGQSVYTIIDWKNSMRGAHNSWGHGTETEEAIDKLAEALELHVSAENEKRDGVELGRNQVSLRIQKVTQAK